MCPPLLSPLLQAVISKAASVRSIPLNQKRTRYTVALARQVSKTLDQALTSSDTTKPTTLYESSISPQPSVALSSPICLSNAQKQHDTYISTLRSILPTFTLPQDPSLPDCVFIEDTAVVIGRHAVINRMASPSRKGEVDAVQNALLQFGLTVDDMRATKDDDNAVKGGATCDGGDVLYVSGKGDLFVGLSSRTNEAGVRFLHDSFSHRGVRVISVPLLELMEESSFLHLKSIVTHVDDRTLLLPRGSLGDELFRLMDGEQRHIRR